MSLKHKLKARFSLRRERIYVDDATLALGYQLGWFEKFLGRIILTETGEQELITIAKNYKEYRANVRS